jgi:hypothetical protein
MKAQVADLGFRRWWVSSPGELDDQGRRVTTSSVGPAGGFVAVVSTAGIGMR